MGAIDDVRAAGAREWSDSVEAISALLGAAGCWTIATTKRRLVARDLARRKATPSDVLTMLLHYLEAGRSAAWIVAGLTMNPEKVWRARSEGAADHVAGEVRWITVRRIDQLVSRIAEALTRHRYEHEQAQAQLRVSLASLRAHVQRISRSAVRSA